MLMRFSFLLTLIILTLQANAQNASLLTPFMQGETNKCPTYAEVVVLCQQYDAAFEEVRLIHIGKSAQGNDIPALVVSRDGWTNIDSIRHAGMSVVLIQAGIHPGEPDGTDAGFMVLHSLLSNKKQKKLLNSLCIVFIPVFNVDGMLRFGPHNRINQNGPEQMGWRTTAQNLNLNRDFMKADAPEMQAWLQFYSQWLPDFTIDCHVTDGADYQYQLTYAIDLFESLDSNVVQWGNEIYLPQINEKMTEDSLKIFPYVMFREWHDPRSGLSLGASPPRLSHGYTILHNRPCLLIETHMLKDYPTRVNATRQMIFNTLEILAGNQKSFSMAIAKADNNVLSSDFRSKPFPIKFTTTDDSVLVDFEGMEYDIKRSDITGGDWFVYHNDQPTTFKVWMFDHIEASSYINLPQMYVIPSAYSDLAQRMQWHGVNIDTLDRDTLLNCRITRFYNVSFANRPYEGRQRPNYDFYEKDSLFFMPAGSFFIPTNQHAVKVIAWLLEAGSDDSFLKWGFFNAIFEQKEYGESYVMEVLAREMLNTNPEIAAAFEREKAKHPEWATDDWAMLNWFYNLSPWRDMQLNLYPVVKIY